MAAVLLGVTGLAGAQEPKRAMFEVASVRLSPPGGDGMTHLEPYGTGRFTATNVSLKFLVELAYNVQDYQLEGGPKWFEDPIYNVSAKGEDGVSLSYEELKPRLQMLLEQRFHLTFHHGMKDFKGYALVVAKGGPKLTPSRGGSGAYVTPNEIRSPRLSMGALAGMLALATKRPVADKTGIAGDFDVQIHYSPESAADSALPSIYTAITEQLGLKLEPGMVPVALMIVDGAERVPLED